MATNTSLIVKILNQAVITKASIIPLSSGDEAGVAGGVVSGTIMGQVQYRSAMPNVKIEGNDVVTVLQTTSHNNNNAPGGAQVAPSQALVMVGP